MNPAVAARADDFAADLRQALAVWRKQPLLPVISILFWTLPSGVSGNDVVDGVLAIVGFLFLGWPGTEREWYRRAFAGEIFSPSEIWPTSRRFFGRFFQLGLLVSPLVLVYFGLIAWLGGGMVAPIALTLVLFFIVDVALTFVTPALTFDTPSATRALSSGIAMLRTHWPAAAPYALTPALVLILGTQALIEPVAGPGSALVATAVAGLVALALKGATAAFYLRHRPEPAPARRNADKSPRRRDARVRRRRLR
jgi:hypothetical protein